MKAELEKFMDESAPECLSSLRDFAGLDFEIGEPKSKVDIRENYVGFEIEYPLILSYEDATASVDRHSFDINMQLGKLYSIARKIMEKETNSSFIEDRTYDLIVLYPEIPSTSVDFECSPKIWTKTSVRESLKSLILNNMPFIKVKGTDYGKSQKYFEMDIGSSDSSVLASFVPLTEPFKFEVIPSEGELLRGQQVIGEGENEALDYLKNLFCISSYHFVYTVGYPMIIQLSDINGNMFQFATLVLIVNNQPKEDKLAGEGITIEPELCKNKLAFETVRTYTADDKGNVIPLNDVDISYKCIRTTCNIGMTKDETLESYFPQCVNGYLIARKEGYAPTKYLVSTNTDNQEISLILEKYINFTINVSVVEDGKIRNVKDDETVVIEMKNEMKEQSLNLIYPTENKANLLKGEYSIKLSLFEKGSFDIAGKNITQCTDVPKAGLLGLLGLTEERCLELETPSVKAQQVFGGGSEFSIEIDKGAAINMYLLKIKTPANADELDAAYQTAKLYSLTQEFKAPEIK